MIPALGNGGQTEILGILIVLLAPFGFAVSFNLVHKVSEVEPIVMQHGHLPPELLLSVFLCSR